MSRIPTSCTPEEQGVDSRALVKALSRIRDGSANIHGLIVARNGQIVLEVYVHPYGKDTLHNVKSVSKSIMSAMVGIAFEEGILTSLEQTVSEFFPEYITDDRDPRKKSITLRHLLTMTSGLNLDENGPIMDEIFSSDDWIEATFAQPMSEDPGQRFRYCTALTHTMSGILSRASEQSMLELCNRYLFGPLHINGIQWKQDSKGYSYGGSELFMTPRDMVKIGLLFLNHGRWNGNQVVPAKWVQQSTSDQMAGLEASDGYGYGYLWWRLGDNRYWAAGWGGQRIIVLPHRNMVVAMTSGGTTGFDELDHDITASSIDDNPMPPNPKALHALESLVRDLEYPTPISVADFPPIAEEISGETYVLEGMERPLPIGNIEDVVFDFTRPDHSTMTFGTSEGTYRLAVGLDGLYRTTSTDNFGRMPRDNRIAVRGRWTTNQTFSIDCMDLSDPNYLRMDTSFSEDGISISLHEELVGSHITMRGTKAS